MELGPLTPVAPLFLAMVVATVTVGQGVLRMKRGTGAQLQPPTMMTGFEDRRRQNIDALEEEMSRLH